MVRPSVKRKIREAASGYIFLMPNFLGFLLFTSGPVLFSLFLAFTRWDLFTPMEWVGLENFVRLLWFHREGGALVANDPRFWQYLGNTGFLMLGIPVGMAGSLFLALVMNQRLKGIVFFRTVYFLPSISIGIALFMLWRWIYNPDFGLMNSLLARIGIEGPGWLTCTAWSKPALMIMSFWIGIGGFNMILYLAGLQGIDPELYEAASIDGAGSWQKFRHITWPMLSPTTFFIFIMSVISGFQGGFEMAYIMTGGGPAGATTTISFYIFNNAYQWFKMGYAASIAWVLFVMVFAVTILNWRLGGRVVHY
ncbi:sugar ABC transporter permease [candidate division NPL-UPA2 bacterium]|nr:sugar ABC transporter permease [candidate division NPL-UPA2 bacterium]